MVLRLLRNRKFVRAFLQAAFLAALIGMIGSGLMIAHESITQQGMSSGFGFLERSTGFNIGFSIIDYDPNASYGRLLLVGTANTILLGVIGIVAASLTGLMVAMMRLSENGSLNAISRTYVEIFRNVPLILQALFWYSVMTHLPPPRQALEAVPHVFLTSRGIFLPVLNVGVAYALGAVGVILAGLVAAMIIRRRDVRAVPSRKTRNARRTVLAAAVLCALILMATGRLEGGLFSLPELRGLNFRGGLTVPPELSALAIAIALYGGAYISEILRAGFNSVPKGQTEAGRALGLSQGQIFRRVRLPLAIRAILPTLTNQYVWLFKATTLGIAVGYSDLFYTVSISITQSGQTLELIGILMMAFLIMNNAISFVLNRINKAIELKGNQTRS
ncbi:ABC transporter permease subunit [Roseovarius spongiae]|uniref:ABC transporter permease subunit n=1 Tax=Roseovarius spongiae TaxID=2320272 RepID=A0A3A8BC26_9RHOB|nr:ABC transporter permease subunit [Roseovarius spongiae]RKF17134.1 ABC transporter permease subunit [Roseovarius spongiae]